MTISKISDTNGKKDCIVLSHFFVTNAQPWKFETVEYVIDFYQSLDYYVILSAHGEISPPEPLIDKMDALYWEEKIDDQELGRGHPKFCVKGFEIARQKGFKHTLKLRAEDIIENKEVLQSLKREIGSYRMIISEQTSLEDGIIGDLFMFGETDFMHGVWTAAPWNYNWNGLKNLYNNFTLVNSTNDVHGFIKKSCLFKSPVDLEWVTVSREWRDTMEKEARHFLWGAQQGYNYYGGF